MLVKLTLRNKMELYIRHDLILIVERNQSNPLESVVTTSLMSKKGPVAYAVLESPETINLAIMDATFKSGIGSPVGVIQH